MIKKFLEHTKEHYDNIEPFDGTNDYRITNTNLTYTVERIPNRIDFKVKFDRLITYEEEIAQKRDIEELSDQFLRLKENLNCDIYIYVNHKTNTQTEPHDFNVVIVNSDDNNLTTYSDEVYKEIDKIKERLKYMYDVKVYVRNKISRHPIIVTVDYGKGSI